MCGAIGASSNRSVSIANGVDPCLYSVFVNSMNDQSYTGIISLMTEKKRQRSRCALA